MRRRWGLSSSGITRPRDPILRKSALFAWTTCVILTLCFMLGLGDAATAASKSQRCEAYAHNAARSAPMRRLAVVPTVATFGPTFCRSHASTSHSFFTTWARFHSKAAEDLRAGTA